MVVGREVKHLVGRVNEGRHFLSGSVYQLSAILGFCPRPVVFKIGIIYIAFAETACPVGYKEKSSSIGSNARLSVPRGRIDICTEVLRLAPLRSHSLASVNIATAVRIPRPAPREINISSVRRQTPRPFVEIRVQNTRQFHRRLPLHSLSFGNKEVFRRRLTLLHKALAGKQYLRQVGCHCRQVFVSLAVYVPAHVLGRE